MDAILALILSCSLYHDDALVRAFIERVSDDNRYFVGELATVTSHDHVADRRAALALVQEVERRGGRPAVGLMAVPVEWASRYGRSASDLFDGCTNIAIGTDVMARFGADCLVRKERARSGTHRPRRLSVAAQRVCILRRFDSELGVRGYPEGVLSELAKRSTSGRETGAESPPAQGNVSPDSTDESRDGDQVDWSDSRLVPR